MGFTTIFGLPRSGKTTYATSIAVKEQIKINRGRSKYDYVYTNFKVDFPDIREINTDTELGLKEITDSLIILDEATMVADARNYMSIPKYLRKYFFLHGHWRVDIIFIVQDWSSLDLGIRRCTERVFYIHKGKIFRSISYCMPIPYDVIIPDPKNGTGDKLGEIIQGYCKPNILVRLFQPRIYRPKWYKYFDSWSHDELPPYEVRTWVKDNDGDDADADAEPQPTSWDIFNE